MSLPDQMTDRWQNRPEPPPGEAVVSWHLLMRDYPEVVDLARQALSSGSQDSTALHMTPMPWLHITTLLAGRRLLPRQAPADDPDRRRPSPRHACSRRHPRLGPLPSRPSLSSSPEAPAH